MKRSNSLSIMGMLIILLSATVCILAILPGEGESYMTTSSWGDEVEMHGRGLYSRDSRSLALQAVAQDWVTLVLGLPFMVVSLILARRNSYRGKLLLTGTMGYFLYTYASYSFLVSYNEVFLIYVALFALSLFGFIFAFGELDFATIEERIGPRFPRKSLGIFFLLIAVLLLFLWLGRIVPPLITGEAPVGLEIYTTLVIQVLDLGVIVPTAVYAAWGLFRKKPMGYALATVVVIKGLMMFLAVAMMAVLMSLGGVDISAFEALVFPIAAAVNLVFGVLILKNIKDVERRQQVVEKRD